MGEVQVCKRGTRDQRGGRESRGDKVVGEG